MNNQKIWNKTANFSDMLLLYYDFFVRQPCSKNAALNCGAVWCPEMRLTVSPCSAVKCSATSAV